jgi:hypothetical protein
MREIVYSFDWYDGPITGVADYLGKPHNFFRKDDFQSDAESPGLYFITPIDSDLLEWVKEDWSIWRRWETAFHMGSAPENSHPALPADRARHEVLKALIKSRSVFDPAQCFVKLAEFWPREDPAWSGYGWRSLEVAWSDPA